MGGAGYVAYLAGAFHTAKAKQPPALPKAVAGTLKEFPVDLSPTNTVKPVSVSTQTIGAPNTQIDTHTLPAGVSSEVLSSAGGKTITSAAYKNKPQDPPVYVNVVDTTGSSQEAARSVSTTIAANATGSTVSGVELKSPSGVDYGGYKIKNPQVEIYVLGKANSGIMICIYAPEPAAMDAAERLTKTVGSGDGLNSDPGFSSLTSSLPAQLPPGVELVEMHTYDTTDLSASMSQLSQLLGGTGATGRSPQSGSGQELLSQAQRFMPERLIVSHYRDAAGGDYTLYVGDYPSALSAWKTWALLRATAGMSQMQRVDVHETSGLTMTQDQQQYLFFQIGSHMAVLQGPGSQSGPLMQLADAIQF